MQICNTMIGTKTLYKPLLTHSFPMHPFSTPFPPPPVRFSDVFRGVEKGCVGNKWVNFWNFEKFPMFIISMLWLYSEDAIAELPCLNEIENSL